MRALYGSQDGRRYSAAENLGMHAEERSEARGRHWAIENCVLRIGYWLSGQ